jgi:subtilase family serine protease
MTTVAVVVAYDHPTILSDLNTYSATYGLPPMADCPVAQGTPSAPCFQKVDQRGGTAYPTQSAGWALETAMDVEIVHALCRNCNLLLVEADTSSYVDLMGAIDRAVALGARVVSNSWGSIEFASEADLFDVHLNVPGVAMTFSSGDGGYGVSVPAASRRVTAVGGTTLTLSGTAYVGETAWAGAGSGCSAYEPKPTWQKDVGCPRRAIADVSAAADPATGAAVYSTVPYYGATGWLQVGGTSLASPLVAATYALSGNTGSTASPANSLPYALGRYKSSLRDVTSGSNGACPPSLRYLCAARAGYDGPTGLGTPLGARAF